MSRRGWGVLFGLGLAACGPKQPVVTEPAVPSCEAFADHLEGIAVASAADDDEAAAREVEALKMRVGCQADNPLAAFLPVVQCLMASETMDTLLMCQDLDPDDAFSDYMKHIMDEAHDVILDDNAPTPTCATFSATFARLRHLELDDVSELEGDALSAAHADIDASMPPFERACTANNQLEQFATIVQCLQGADSEATVGMCADDPRADGFDTYLQQLISTAQSAE